MSPPVLTMTRYSMDIIFINDLMVRGVIGVSERERANKQDIIINVQIETDISKCAISDEINESVNYRTVSKKIISHVESSSRFTVEALASDIAQICLSFNGVAAVTVQVEKPSAVRFSKSVGVKIKRIRDA